jgi:hypothetical protein
MNAAAAKRMPALTAARTEVTAIIEANMEI